MPTGENERTDIINKERVIVPAIEERDDDGDTILKVAAATKPQSLAGSISSMLDKRADCRLLAIGAGAVNQAVKAVAIARGMMAPKGYDVSMSPYFAKVNMNKNDSTGEEAGEKTGLKFQVVRRQI
ncbi:stage V sporulation protein S [bacterium]|jgi:stage V sporulation protein S|nr:stage V sporulation protein S [bacterium]